MQGWRDAPSPSGPWADAVRDALRGASSVLDVGAGDRAWQDVLRRLGLGHAAYASLDVETRHAHEHRSLDEVDASSYDAALVLEVLEHLDAQTGVDLLEDVARVLRPGGALVVSTPNPAHPTSFQASDLTHVRPWPAHDLHGVLGLVGFERVVVHRLLHVEARRRPLVPAQKAVARLIGVDPADHLLVTAVRT